MPEVAIAIAAVVAMLDSSENKGKKQVVSFSSEDLPMAMVQVTSSRTYNQDCTETWEEYARTGIPK